MQSSVPNSTIPVFFPEELKRIMKTSVRMSGLRVEVRVWGLLKSEQESCMYKVRPSRWNESKTVDDQTLKAVRT